MKTVRRRLHLLKHTSTRFNYCVKVSAIGTDCNSCCSSLLVD